MWANIITTPPKNNISLVRKGKSVVPQKVQRQTLLEKQGYKIGKWLGDGGFATVKLAESKKHGCRVAIKIINKLVADKEYLRDFLPREVKIMHQLNHPNIIRFFEAFETETKVYLIMEFAQNGDLLQHMNEHGQLDEDEAKLTFFQLATAMAYLKSEDVAHRDVKCENLLLDDQGFLKLTDFGFATHTHGGRLLEETCGSFDYVAPEVHCHQKYNGHQSDVWSMGVTLYVMLNKQTPFTDEQLQNLDFSNKVKFAVKVSKDCKHLVRKMLSPEPHKRPTIEQILESAWLKKVPKKNPQLMEYTTSKTRVASEIKSRAQSKRSGLIIKCDSTFSVGDVSDGRRSSLVSDVVNAAKEEADRLERRRKLLNAHEPSPIDELIHYKYAKNTKDQANEEKAMEDLKNSRAAGAAQLAAAGSKDERRKSVEQNQLKSWKMKYGRVLAPPEFDKLREVGLK